MDFRVNWPNYTEKDQERCRQWAAELDKFGAENVRIILSGNFSLEGVDRRFAWEWLRYQDEQKRSRDIRIATWTLAASIIAAVAGVGALAVGILALK
jgi:hypothetical protein